VEKKYQCQYNATFCAVWWEIYHQMPYQFSKPLVLRNYQGVVKATGICFPLKY